MVSIYITGSIFHWICVYQVESKKKKKNMEGYKWYNKISNCEMIKVSAEDLLTFVWFYEIVA